MIRTFIGLELDEGIREELGAEIETLRMNCPKINWVRPPNLHVTLKFLGALSADELPETFEAVKSAAAEAEPFSLEIERLGAFPALARARIVWAGCGVGSRETTLLARELEASFEVLGYPPEKKAFTPHVTIGRVRHPRDADGLEELVADTQNTSYGIADIEVVTLFMSDLKRGGAEYTPMFRAPLG